MTPLDVLLAAAIIVLAAGMCLSIVYSEKPLAFQWFATAFLMVAGLLTMRRGAEGWGYALIALGAVWLLVQPLPDTIRLMRKIERGEKG